MFLECQVCSAQRLSGVIQIASSGLPSTERETTGIRTLIGCALVPYLVRPKTLMRRESHVARTQRPGSVPIQPAWRLSSNYCHE